MTPSLSHSHDASSNQFPKTRALIFTLCAACLPGMACADALIDQSGNAHIATIDQSAVSAQSDAYISQSGESNISSIVQADLADYSISSEITQTGEGNETTIEQLNLTYEAHVQAFSIGNGNTVQIRQVSQGEAVSYATAVQFGDDNHTVILQENNEFGAVDADVYQEGVSNEVWLQQYEDGAGSADISQIGDLNLTTVYQDGDAITVSGTGFSYVFIEGYENDVTIQQSNTYGSSISYVQRGSSSTANIYQAGETQSISVDGESTHNNADTIYQTSESGTINVTRQSTSDSDTNILQTGGWDAIQVDQLDSHFVTANVIQDGFVAVWNEANILQSSSEHSIATIEQSGLESTASIEQQHVTDSEASIIQDSLLIQADITQHSGEANVAAIIQTVDNGEGVSASIFQAGNGNEAVISQM